jgi:hypothetical protein
MRKTKCCTNTLWDELNCAISDAWLPPDDKFKSKIRIYFCFFSNGVNDRRKENWIDGDIKLSF